jgi:hypothetical protein
MASPLQTSYISEIGSFLKDFDKANPQLSASQQAEIEKARRIALMRDNASAEETLDENRKLSPLWEQF